MAPARVTQQQGRDRSSNGVLLHVVLGYLLMIEIWSAPLSQLILVIEFLARPQGNLGLRGCTFTGIFRQCSLPQRVADDADAGT